MSVHYFDLDYKGRKLWWYNFWNSRFKTRMADRPHGISKMESLIYSTKQSSQRSTPQLVPWYRDKLNWESSSISTINNKILKYEEILLYSKIKN